MSKAATHSDSRSALETTNAKTVIDHQLTENTGRHPLDSGDAYGRNFEENRETHPSEQPTFSVEPEYVVHNIWAFMNQNLRRDHSAVETERALYNWCESRDVSPALTHMETFAHQRCGEYYSFNTYNDSCHALSQDLQVVSLGGIHAEYKLVQVHGGCDIRGGYTNPRVYAMPGPGAPRELCFKSETGDWTEYESCLYGEPSLVWQPTIDTLELEETATARLEQPPEEISERVRLAVADAHDTSHTDGAVFRIANGDVQHVEVV
jgi:hypothetical protein